MTDTGIAIIGLGGVFPGADNVRAFWENICKGKVSIGEVPRDRWNTELYFSTDRASPDKSYARIGGFIDKVPFDRSRFRIPPKTLEAIDDVQKMALTVVAEALADAGLQVMPDIAEGKPFDRSRTAVILANAMGGEQEDLTSLRIWYPHARTALLDSPAFRTLPAGAQEKVLVELEQQYKRHLPNVTEDSMPGELSNCIAGRVANLFDLRGPNFTTDAACAASMAALFAAVDGLRLGHFDLAIAGGVDRSMDPPTYVKFSKIGALSADGSFPFDARANGFVMGEGGGVLVLKRLADAERDGDKIYAVVRAVGAASDGKGKGMTAPNPRGQRLAVERAWETAGLDVASAGLFEAHGTSTVVGDATELRVLSDLLAEKGARDRQVPVGSVKSMIGHLKSAAGAASLIKTALALHHKMLPPSAGFSTPPADSPLHERTLRVVTSAQAWQAQGPRRAGVSSFGFGGTNFHVVLEEAGGSGVPGLVAGHSGAKQGLASVSGAGMAAIAPSAAAQTLAPTPSAASGGATRPDMAAVLAQVIAVFADKTGYDVADLDPTYQLEADLGIDTVKQAEIFGVLREKYSLGRDESFRLSDVQTLEKVASYLTSKMGTSPVTESAPTMIPTMIPTMTPTNPSVTPMAVSAAAPALAATPVPSRETLVGEIVALFAQHTGYDLADLVPSYQLEADLGIDTVKQAEIFGVLREKYGLPKDPNFRLSAVQTLDAVVDYVASSRAASPAVAASAAPSPSVTSATSVSAPGSAIAAGSSSAPALSAAPLTETALPRILLFGGADRDAVLADATRRLAMGSLVAAAKDNPRAAKAQVRLAFVASTLDEATTKLEDAKTGKAKRLAAQGIFLAEGQGLGAASPIACLFPGQGSQYLGMLEDLAKTYPVVAETFAEAEAVLEPLIGQKLTDIVWAKPAATEVEAADLRLRQTEICQPAMLTADVAMLRLLHAHGLRPTMVAGHSLGEYAAAVAAGVLSLADALYAVSARGREMAGVKVDDCGKMATVAASAEKVEAILAKIQGYVIAANKNCHAQTVIAGASPAVVAAVAAFQEAGLEAREIPVSHAFHSSIVAPAAKPLRTILARLNLGKPQLDIISNVTAAPYPASHEAIVELMAKQLESPVEFIATIERMYSEGARVFIEVGPRRAITGFVRNVLDKRSFVAVDTNHHKRPGPLSFLEALAQLAVEGVGLDFDGRSDASLPAVISAERAASTAPALANTSPTSSTPGLAPLAAADRQAMLDPVVVTGTAVFLPRPEPVRPIEEDIVAPLLRGDSFIVELDAEQRQAIVDKNVVRLDKRTGGFEVLTHVDEVLRLAARLGEVDLAEYGIDANIADSMDTTCRLAVAVGLDALRDAGLPLVRRYRTTSTGKQLPDRWVLPEQLAKGTGVILACAFPGQDRLFEEVSRAMAAQYAKQSAQVIDRMVATLAEKLPAGAAQAMVQAAGAEEARRLRDEASLYQFNRKLLLQSLALGHAQLAQVLLAQGPAMQMNTACASGTQAIGLAQDWLQSGRCDRVIVVSADDVTNDRMLPWIGSGFLVTGAASTEADVKKAAVPFGEHRNGLILGAAATALVLERDSAAKARGLEPIAEIVGTYFGNMAHHVTRLDTDFVARELDTFVKTMAAKLDLSVAELGQRTVFVSHETYTPARGGSAAAEVQALRRAFGEGTGDVLIANTKGYTGHTMGASIEDILAVKGLQRQEIPAIANLDAVDPDFHDLRFARGGKVDIELALRFAAGFGSQMALALYRRRATHEARLTDPSAFRTWLDALVGKAGQKLEIVNRTLRVAESGGSEVWELGIPSLKVPTQAAALASAASTVAASPTPVVGPVMAAATSAAPARAQLLTEIIAIFAEHTGYEATDLVPSYLLEADLGIDTVKQAEILGLLRQRYGLAKDESFRLSDVQSIDKVVDYVATTLAAAAAKQLAARPAVAASASAAPALNAPAASPVQPVSTASSDAADPFAVRPVVVRELEALTPLRSLRGRRLLLVTADAAQREQALTSLRREGAVVAELDVSALRPDAVEAALAALPTNLDDLVYVAAPCDSLAVEALESRVSLAFAVARAFARRRGTMDGAAVLLCGQGGAVFGVEAVSPMGVVLGGLAGLAKTLAREWPKARVLCADLDPRPDFATALAGGLRALVADGPAEIACRGERLLTLGRGAPQVLAPRPLPSGSVVVATGGARGVTFEILRQLAERSPLRVVIMGRTPAIAPEESPLFGRAEAEHKDIARTRLTLAGERVTPAAIKTWIGKEEARLEVARNLESLAALGCEVDFRVCDVADETALAQTAAQIRWRYGRVELLLHGAGVEESKLIADKDGAAFARVFAPKARAGLWLWSALRPRRTLTMGSIAGRFGNAGQADYAAANELLAALSRNPQNHVVNVAWTAWGDVGMATRGSVRQVLESFGVELLPVNRGKMIGANLAAAEISGDFVVAGKLGALAAEEERWMSLALPVSSSETPRASTLPGIFDRRDDGLAGPVFLRRFSVARDLGLDHHRLDGVAVLPGVIGVELMSRAAEAASGRKVRELTQVRFAVPVKLFRDEPVEVRVETTPHGDDVGLVVSTIFVGPGGKTQRREHFFATAVLGPKLSLEAPPTLPLDVPRRPDWTKTRIYERYFHGPRFQVIGGVEALAEDGITARLTDERAEWVDTGGASLLTAPLLREAGFQTAGLWEMALVGRMSLPAGIERIVLSDDPPPSGETTVYLEARRRSVSDEGAVFDVWVRDAEGRIYDVMLGYKTAFWRELGSGMRFEPIAGKGEPPARLAVELAAVRHLLVERGQTFVDSFLSPAEAPVFAGLKTEKRRVDWLAGRIAAKRLWRNRRFSSEGAIIPYAAISVLPDELGAPQVAIAGESAATGSRPMTSLTHGAGLAMAAVATHDQLRIGIDIEAIERRDPTFLADYFDAEEQKAARDSGAVDLWATTMWALKEATSKALGIGARVDLRDIRVRREGDTWNISLVGAARERAHNLGVGVLTAEVEPGQGRVFARVLLEPVAATKSAAATAFPEASS